LTRARALVLGSAAGGGFPQWNCRCPVCALAWAGDPRVRPRTQSSLALTGDGTEWVLVNASPDLGQQLRATPALWPRAGLRHSPIAAVVLTSAEIDHCAGLLSLRERQPFALVATAAVHAALAANPIFAALDPSLVPRQVVEPGERFDAAGLALELVAVPGKAPLYAEGPSPEIGTETGEAAGLFAEAGDTRLAYVPGCAHLSDDLGARLRRADIVLFDGTLFSDDEMIVAGISAKSGRRMGHLPIAGEGGSLQALAELPARRRIYVHINNTNPVLIDGSPEAATVAAAGIEIAHDGMEIAL
jgi:pyrroloquinoline quinone biosynthesis protein B